jgi:hypothetical protein
MMWRGCKALRGANWVEPACFTRSLLKVLSRIVADVSEGAHCQHSLELISAATVAVMSPIQIDVNTHVFALNHHINIVASSMLTGQINV